QFWVTVTNGFQCEATSDVVTVSTANSIVPVITKSNDSLLAAGPFVTYQWWLDGTMIPGAINDFYVPTMNGYYQVSTTDTNGCTAVSDSLLCNAVNVGDQLTKEFGLHIYPNPARNVLHLRTLSPIDWNLDLTLTDMYGKQVKSFTMAHLIDDAALDISALSAGMYVLEVTTEKGHRVAFRFVIE
ncbi:MAG: T9SS type A sorting domain-containing protein, partial [Bacteroidota bacterium]